MLLKSLELENFRQFFGIQRIEFADSKDKNVTVIMGENTSGKTTLAQAFTWCFYGKTKFKSHEMLSIPASLDLNNSEECNVRVSINLLHNDTEYAIERRQTYRKDALGNISSSAPVLSISYLGRDGQTEYIDDRDRENIIQEILPESLSGYFFFDGERIDRMSKEIQEGRSREFAKAVESLLGLTSITEALTHLKGSGTSNSVIRYYQQHFNRYGDAEFEKLMNQIVECENQIDKVSKQKQEAEDTLFAADTLKTQYHDEIVANNQSKELGDKRTELTDRKRNLDSDRITLESALIQSFQKRSWKYFLNPLLAKAREQLKDADITDKSVPGGINADTVDALIKRGECICGTHIDAGSKEFHALSDLLQFIPPQSLGTSIKNYQNEADAYADETSLYIDIDSNLVLIRNNQVSTDGLDGEIEKISKQLIGMKNISEIETNYRHISKQITETKDRIDYLTKLLGKLETEKKRFETEKSKLRLTDETNKKIKQYLAYAEYMYAFLQRLYSGEETKTRKQLESAINAIFQSVFSGSFRLELDEKYNIKVIDEELTDSNYDPETSEAQSIAVIFAFIAGVIKLARDEDDERSDMLLTEAYPLVMDAPLSNFDKKRIKAVSDLMPKIAEQVVIFIKDTDGELAEEHMRDYLGARYDIHVTEQNRKSLIEKWNNNV